MTVAVETAVEVDKDKTVLLTVDTEASGRLAELSSTDTVTLTTYEEVALVDAASTIDELNDGRGGLYELPVYRVERPTDPVLIPLAILLDGRGNETLGALDKTSLTYPAELTGIRDEAGAP